MQDLMVDIETLGVSSDSIIVQIGACYFNRYTGDIGEKFLVNIDPLIQAKMGFKTDNDTLRWWQKQPITWDKDTMDIIYALTYFKRYASKAKNVWCHSTFDFPILMSAYKRIVMKPPFHYTDARDIRTLDDLANIPRIQTKNPKTHSALEDCLHQVEYCVPYFNELKKTL